MANPSPAPGRGRPKGVKNKVTNSLRERIKKKYPNFCPVEQLLQFAQDETEDTKLRAQCCKDAALYLYPKLRSVELTGANGEKLQASINVNFVKSVVDDKDKS